MPCPFWWGAGDAPLLPATMEGKPVALYFSTTVDRFYAGDVAAYGGKDTGETAEIIINGKGSVSRPILRTGSLRLGEIDPDAAVFSLTDRSHVLLVLNGRKRIFQLDPNAPLNHLPVAWSKQANDDSSENDRYVAASFTRPTGSHPAPITVQLDGITNTVFHSGGDQDQGVLGIEFFMNHIVMFDYPNRKPYVLSSPATITAKGAGLRYEPALAHTDQDRFQQPEMSWPLTPRYASTGVRSGLP